MHISVLSVATAALTVLAPLAGATVFTGTLEEGYPRASMYAWTNHNKGDSPCDTTPSLITHNHFNDQSGCGVPFWMNGAIWELRGCGGQLTLYKSSALNSYCHYAPKFWYCGKQGGNHDIVYKQDWACY